MLRNLGLRVVIAVLVFTIFTPTVVVAKNALANPDFDGGREPWRVDVFQATNAYGVWSSSEGSPVSGSLAAAAMFPGDSVQVWQCLSAPDAAVDFSARAKPIYGEREAIYVMMFAFESANCSTTAIESVRATEFFDVGAGWREYRKTSHTFPASTNSVALFMIADVATASNLTYFDHAIVAPAGTIILDRIFMHGFEP